MSEFEALRARLAAPALTAADVFTCGRELERLAGAQAPLRVAIAGDATLEFVQNAVACALAQEGELASFYLAPFGTVRQACLDPNSGLHAFRPDLVLLMLEARALAPELPADATRAQADAWVAERVAECEALWSALEASGRRIVQHLFVPPVHGGRGVAERRSPASARSRVQALNEALLRAGAGRVSWVELDRLAEASGMAAWSPERFHHAGRLPFDPRFLPDYLPWFRATWRCAMGRVKKVLAVDLDETLWGGVIGDDGAEAIVLGPDHGARGEAFAAWQRHLAQLARRGVVLAVCSKNEPQPALAGLGHPSSALGRSDFSAFVCSWGDKAAGLRQVAADLGVGLDSLVFADDNPAECALVRQLLPEVAVVELGADPAQFIGRLEAGHWFDIDAYTPEDLARTASYAARTQARAAAHAATDLDAFLRGLDMKGRMGRAKPEELPRLAQLEARTNQFNLTTRRTPQARLAEWLDDPCRLVLAFHLKDRFGDHGLVGSLVAVREGQALRIDSWLLSCRVFARTAEEYMLAGLIGMAKEQGATALLAEYIPTERNGVVADLLPRLGFRLVPGAQPLWQRSLATGDGPESLIRDEAGGDGRLSAS